MNTIEDFDHTDFNNEQEFYEFVNLKGLKYPKFLADKLKECYKSIQYTLDDLRHAEQFGDREAINLCDDLLKARRIEYNAIKKVIESIENIGDREDIAFKFLILEKLELGSTRKSEFSDQLKRLQNAVSDLESNINILNCLLLFIFIVGIVSMIVLLIKTFL